jgi:hypothetical protein
MAVWIYSIPIPTTPETEVAMSAVAASAAIAAPPLNLFDLAFVRTVLEHRGLFRQPSAEEFDAALAELRRYRDQCLDNPRERDAWEPEIAEESLAELRAKVFVMFGVTKPSPAQWHKAYTALFGPLLCETCG